MASRWMKEICHWLWLFQNCLIEYCQPDIHGLPGLLRKWSIRTIVLTEGCLVLSTGGLYASYAALLNMLVKRPHWEFYIHLDSM